MADFNDYDDFPVSFFLSRDEDEKDEKEDEVTKDDIGEDDENSQSSTIEAPASAEKTDNNGASEPETASQVEKPTPESKTKGSEKEEGSIETGENTVTEDNAAANQDGNFRTFELHYSWIADILMSCT